MKYILFLSILLNFWFQFKNNLIDLYVDEVCKSENKISSGFDHGYYSIGNTGFSPLFIPEHINPHCIDKK